MTGGVEGWVTTASLNIWGESQQLQEVTPDPMAQQVQVITPSATPDIGEGCPDGCVEYKPGCEIKGNISITDGEKIYHLPGWEMYDEVLIEPVYGERWFCTEEEATKNGWRPSRR
jgi:hypothetical protein